MADFASLAPKPADVVDGLLTAGGKLFTDCRNISADLSDKAISSSNGEDWTFTYKGKTVALNVATEMESHVDFASAVVSFIGITPEIVTKKAQKREHGQEARTRKTAKMLSMEKLRGDLNVILVEEFIKSEEGKKKRKDVTADALAAYSALKKANSKQKDKTKKLSDKQLKQRREYLLIEADGVFQEAANKWVKQRYAVIMQQEKAATGSSDDHAVILSKLAEYDTQGQSIAVCMAFPFRVEYDVMRIDQVDCKTRLETLRQNLQEGVTAKAAEIKNEALKDQKVEAKIKTLETNATSPTVQPLQRSRSQEDLKNVKDKTKALEEASGLDAIKKAFDEFAQAHPEHDLGPKARLDQLLKDEKAAKADLTKLEEQLKKWYADRSINNFKIRGVDTYGTYSKGIGAFNGMGLNAELHATITASHTPGRPDSVQVIFDQIDKRAVPLKQIEGTINTEQGGSVTFYPAGGIATTGDIGDFIVGNHNKTG